jgi:hypothetical protein
MNIRTALSVVIGLFLPIGILLSSCEREKKAGSVSVKGETEFSDSEFSFIHLVEVQAKQEEQLKELLRNRDDEWFEFHQKFEGIIRGSKRITVPIENRKFVAQIDPGVYVAYAHFKGFSKVYLLDLTTSKKIFIPGKYTENAVVTPL